MSACAKRTQKRPPPLRWRGFGRHGRILAEKWENGMQVIQYPQYYRFSITMSSNLTYMVSSLRNTAVPLVHLPPC